MLSSTEIMFDYKIVLDWYFVRMCERGSQWTDWWQIVYWDRLWKICQGIPNLVRMAQKCRTLYLKA
jgi:hypothetical protein